jgi:hypothetical protein
MGDCTLKLVSRLAVLFSSLMLTGIAARPQQAPASSPEPPAKDSQTNAEFTAAADEVLAQMSEITGLKLKSPLKKTLRSRAEIRAYVIKEMDDEKKPAERYAGARSAEAFGLLPKNFDFDAFMIKLLTEQIAGLYDPKAHEFYIADWIPLSKQRDVMAHELTHALEDQYFNIEAWSKAARPDDDAELARDAVLEGSATAAMVDYNLEGTGMSLKSLPDFDPSTLVGDIDDSPAFNSAPPFLKDALIFPYMSGLTFSVALLKSGGWVGLPSVFAKPPATTQQIMHPALYRSGKLPEHVVLPGIEKLLGPGWTKLEDNAMGEFGWREVLKQFLDDSRAKPLAAAWNGDRYLVYENKSTKSLVLVTRIYLSSEDQTARFFGQYSEALEKKHDQRTNLFRRPGFFSFDTPDGAVFLRCLETDCITLEGSTRAVFDGLDKQLGWPPAPQPPLDPAKTKDPNAVI